MEVFSYFWDCFYTMNPHFGFSKSEHLCGDTRISRLFTQGESFIVYPLRVVYILTNNMEEEDVSVLISVPKKRFKRAVKRNRLKRLIREAYRHNKHQLIESVSSQGKKIHLSFNYVSDELMDFETINKKMQLALDKLIKKIIEA
jgi:ribonuclease P protein component